MKCYFWLCLYPSLNISGKVPLISMVFSCLCSCHSSNHFFRLYQKDKSEFKVKFRQVSNCCKRVLEAAKLAYANKTKEAITSQKLGSWDFWRIANSVLKKSKSAIRFHWWSLCLRMSGKGWQLKTTALLVFFLWLVKTCK